MTNYSFSNRNAPKRRSHTALFGPITAIVLVLVIVIGMSVFFRVQNIDVEGATIYSEDEIIEASGIDKGDNLLFVNCSRDSSRIFSRLAYVESAVITRELPDRIIITVSESYATAYVDWEGQYWVMNASCKLLGSVGPDELTGLIHVLNVIPLAPDAGENLVVDSSASLQLSYLQQLLSSINMLGMTQDISELDMDNPTDPTFTYLGRFTVKMGTDENIEYKLRMLLAAVEQIDDDVTGTIDLSEGTTVHMSPD